MKKLICILVFFGSCIIESVAQSNPEQKIAQLVERFNTAMLNADGPTLETLVAGDLSYGHSGGQVDTKTRFIDDLVKGTVDFFTVNISGQTIAVSGNNAIVRHTLNASVTNKGTKADLHLGVLMVWRLHKGSWQLLARQGYRL